MVTTQKDGIAEIHSQHDLISAGHTTLGSALAVVLTLGVPSINE